MATPSELILDSGPLVLFPGKVPMVQSLPSNARDIGSIPGLGTKIPHTRGHLSQHLNY